MEFFDGGQLTPAGRAALEDGETQVASAAGVALQGRNKELLPVPGAAQGQALCTTHNVWWWATGNEGTGTPIKLPLGRVLKAEAHKSMFRRYPRIDLYFAKDPSAPLVRLVFSGSECGEFEQRLQTSIQRQGWKAPKKVVRRESGFNTQFAGVGGVMRRQEREREQTQTLTSEAFSDLNALMESASEIVTLADRFSEAVRQRKAKEAAGAGAAAGEEEEFFALLNDMGIANPATKRACGSKYHEELARELADFLTAQLQRHTKSGIIALTDLFCLVNRARGTALISPNDLFQACALMEPLGMPYTLKRFDSGVCVLQSLAHSDKATAQALLGLLAQREQAGAGAFLTSILVAREMSISLQLALEQLRTAEKLGHLCRDETLQGVAFFRNMFAQVPAANPPVPPG